MATALQACQALDDVLRLPAGTAEGAARRIRSAGLIASTQGVPAPISAEDIAAILVAVVTSSAVAADYLSMPPTFGARRVTFVEALARFINNPHELLELRIDATVPGAVLTYCSAEDSIWWTLMFEHDDTPARPAFQREIRIGPDVFTNLAAALAAAPDVRAGRPPFRERYRRMERAVVY